MADPVYYKSQFNKTTGKWLPSLIPAFGVKKLFDSAKLERKRHIYA